MATDSIIPKQTMDEYKDDNTNKISPETNLSVAQSAIDETKDDANPETNFKESRVSKKFSELSTKRVVILVLTVILMMPFFTLETYFTDVSP